MSFKKVNGIEVIELGKKQYSVSWLRSVTEEQAVRSCTDKKQVKNAWKQANGKSVRNYTKPDTDAETEKPAKKTTKKKSDKDKKKK